MARRLALLIGIGLAASACVQPKDPGVSITSVQSNIVFGAKPKAKTPTPPGVLPKKTTDTGESDLPDDDLSDLEEFEKPYTPPLPNVQVNCPEAREDAFPETSATAKAEGRVAAGRYRWKQSGKVTFVGIETPFAPFGYRTINEVGNLKVEQLEAGDPVDPTKPAERTEYEYKIRQPNLVRSPGGFGAFNISTIRVKNTPLAQRVTPPVAPVPLPASNTAGGEPDRGISLVRTEEYSGRSDSFESSFNPSPPVLLAPLPIVTGEVWQSVGVDPESGATLHVDGRVGSRQQVDACGTMIEGWEIVTTQTFTGGDGVQTVTKYTFVVATQYGGLVIAEKLEPAGGVTQVPAQTYTIGQLKPTVAP